MIISGAHPQPVSCLRYQVPPYSILHNIPIHRTGMVSNISIEGESLCLNKPLVHLLLLNFPL
jgi:hypothetical protein